MPSTLEEKRSSFRQLHAGGCFVMPNPWDLGSARLLQHLGFVALASSSAAFAWSTGRPDYALSRDAVLAHLTELCAAVDVPVNADFESGFAREPEAVASNVLTAVQTGIAGLSIEDRDVSAPYALLDRSLSVERIRAARAALDGAAADVVLVARCERLLREPEAVTATIDTLVALADAGADCLFAPGVRQREHIVAMVRAVAPKPLNVVMMKPGPSVAELTEWGVRRISTGGALARVVWGALLNTAKEIQSGSFAGFGAGAPGATLNEIFGRFQ